MKKRAVTQLIEKIRSILILSLMSSKPVYELLESRMVEYSLGESNYRVKNIQLMGQVIPEAAFSSSAVATPASVLS